MPISEKKLLRSLINKAMLELYKQGKINKFTEFEEISRAVKERVEIYKIRRIQSALDKIADPECSPEMLEEFLESNIEMEHIEREVNNN